ncbi:hypothetical protein GF369_04330 [Candidatus Peregrinibacteria bacterium]|nr:hypothetical protein [Candidatus Peregrinibacteria bacterium]
MLSYYSKKAGKTIMNPGLIIYLAVIRDKLEPEDRYMKPVLQYIIANHNTDALAELNQQEETIFNQFATKYVEHACCIDCGKQFTWKDHIFIRYRKNKKGENVPYHPYC